MNKEKNPFSNIESYRSDPYRPKQSLYISHRVAYEQLYERHSSNAYFLTPGLSKTNHSLDEERRIFGEAISFSFAKTFETFMIAGFICGIEMYNKHKHRPSKKAFRPHAHIVIFTYNEFLHLPKGDFEQELLQKPFDYKLDTKDKPRRC